MTSEVDFILERLSEMFICVAVKWGLASILILDFVLNRENAFETNEQL